MSAAKCTRDDFGGEIPLDLTMSPNETPPELEESTPNSVFSLRGLFALISIVCFWGAAANYAFSNNRTEEASGVLIPLVVISGIGLCIALAQLPLFFLVAHWIKKRK